MEHKGILIIVATEKSESLTNQFLFRTTIPAKCTMLPNKWLLILHCERCPFFNIWQFSEIIKPKLEILYGTF